MHIMLLGVNHRTAGVELREKLAMAGHRLEQAIDHLRGDYPRAEVVVLSTCNRTELYLARPPLEPPSSQQVLDFLSRFSGVDDTLLGDVVLCLENQQAVNHLFRVASGLESMVLGEPQILGQVKRAYATATERLGVGPTFHRVFQQAIGVAKRTRAATGIGSGRVSVGSAAVDFARQVFERFDDKTVVGIGAGELAKPMLYHLWRLQPAKLWVTNRSADKAQQLMIKLGLSQQRGGVWPFDALDDLLMEADIVLTSTGATEPIITEDRFKPLLRRRRSRPLFIVDIAVPRDVEPAVGRLNNVYLYNIDDLQRVVDQTRDRRAGQVQACEAMLAVAVRSCVSQVQNQDIGHLIRSLKRRLHDLGRIERERTQRKLASSRPEDLARFLPQMMEEHTHRLINKILHLPLSHLDRCRPDQMLGFYAAALRVLFGLSDDQPDSVQGVESRTDSTKPASTPTAIDDDIEQQSTDQAGGILFDDNCQHG